MNRHHYIPRSVKEYEVIRLARKGGFKFEGKHGNHPKYNEIIRYKITEFLEKNPNPTPKQAVEFLRGLVKDIKEAINNNPNTKINDLEFENTGITPLPLDNIKNIRPDLDEIELREESKRIHEMKKEREREMKEYEKKMEEFEKTGIIMS